MPVSIPTSISARNPIGATRGVAEHTAQLVRLELELRVLELRRKAVALGLASGLGLAALLLAPLLVVFLLAAAAAALSTVVHVWLAILIVSAALLLVIAGLAGAAALLAAKALKKTGEA